MKFLIAGLGSGQARHMRNLIALGEKDLVLLRSHRATLSDDELAGIPVETDLHEALRNHKRGGRRCEPDLHAFGCGYSCGTGGLRNSVEAIY